jgi:hypothetical protein
VAKEYGISRAKVRAILERTPTVDPVTKEKMETRRAVAARRAAARLVGKKKGRPRAHAEREQEILDAYGESKNVKGVAREFGIPRSTVRGILKRAGVTAAVPGGRKTIRAGLRRAKPPSRRMRGYELLVELLATLSAECAKNQSAGDVGAGSSRAV